MIEYENGWKFGDLDTRVMDKDNEFLVIEDFHIQWGQLKYTVKKGETIDFASIPPGLRNSFNRLGKSRKPAAMHDSMYRGKFATRAYCDLLFYKALMGIGMQKWKAWLYYAGVRSWGWTRGNW